MTRVQSVTGLALMVEKPNRIPETDDVSLSDQETLAGASDTDAPSLASAMTMGANVAGGAAAAEDAMDLVDLATRYEFERQLGKGGMGEVMLATDTRLMRKVAIKRVLDDRAGSQVAVARFLMEAQSVAALNHPNIVQIYDYGRDKDGPFLIMEYVDGSNLLARCEQGAFAVDEAVRMACQLCEGLAKAHNSGIWHRDIKPANVLLTSDGIPKLTDFGLAKYEAAETGLSVAGAVLGTLDFMPLEQRKDTALVDHRSDLWSLAATLYQMVTGRSPKVIRFNNVPRSLHDVLGKALEDAKDDRYQSAIEFRDALRSCLKSRAPVPQPILGSGECAQCRVLNEPTRKFCRECAASLRAPCLECGVDMPVWDKVCGDCGCKQLEILAARRAHMDSLRTEAESMRDRYEFDEAIDAARQVGVVDDSRLQHLQDWCETFIADTQAAQQREQEHASSQSATAKAYFEAYNYRSAIEAIDTIPEAMRSAEVRELQEQARSRDVESTELLRTIQTRAANQDLDGLYDLVERVIELLGERDDLLLLRFEVLEHRMTLYHEQLCVKEAAEPLLEEGKVREAMQLMESVSVDQRELEPSFVELRTRLRDINRADEELKAMVKEANADGVLDPDEVAALYQAAENYLKMNPRHQKISRMRDQLSRRILSSPRDYAEFPSLAGFWSALPSHVLSNLPMSLMTRFPPEVFAEFPPEFVAKLPKKVQEQIKAGKRKQQSATNRPSKNLTREELKEWARDIDPDAFTRCPYCDVELKIASLVRHVDQQHSAELSANL